MRGLINAGHDEEEMLEALAQFREWLIVLREDNRNRLPVRRDGHAKLREDGTRVFGPFTLEVRRKILDRLRALEAETAGALISPAEIEVIEDVWRRDRIREDGRLALLASVGVTSENLSA